MTTRLVSAILACAMLGAFPPGAAARERAQTPATRLRVYLDCDCFQDFLRTEIRWVDFVRDPKDADLQVLSSIGETGGGGQEIVLRFIGLGRFAGSQQELRVVTIPADTEDTTRRKVLDVVTVGMLGLIARDGLPDDIGLAVRSNASGAARDIVRDPWNLWVFQIGGDGSFQSEETSNQRAWEVQMTADRVTDEWKVSVGVSLEHENERFDLDEDEPLEVTRRERSVDWFIAKSLGEHVSLGLDGDFGSSTFDNIRRGTEVAPAIEFNLFPYSQYASRQLRIEYAIGIAAVQYNEVTIYGKLQETLGQQQISVTLDQREAWGSLQAGVEWSQYLHDFTKSRLEIEGELSFRLARGFSIQVEGAASRIRDQLSLPLRGATPEEVLLRVRQLQSGYEVQLSVGGAYSFGSIFNNIVNPRFGR